MIGVAGCNPSGPVRKIEEVNKQLNSIHMGDRIPQHYTGGDIGVYLEQFSWSDAAMVMAWEQFDPFIDFFDLLRNAAIEKNLSKHSPIRNSEIPLIFFEAYPNENPFGDVEVSPLPVDVFYQKLELYRGRVPTNSKGEQNGVAKPIPSKVGYRLASL